MKLSERLEGYAQCVETGNFLSLTDIVKLKHDAAELEADNERLRGAVKTLISEVDDYMGWLAEQDVVTNVSDLDDACNKARAALEVK